MQYTPTPDATDNFDWTWRIIVKSLPFLAAKLATEGSGAPKLAPGLIRIMKSELTLLEALMRRLLMMLAMTMRPSAMMIKPKPDKVHNPAPRLPRRISHDGEARVPQFSILEPQPAALSLSPVDRGKKKGIQGPAPRVRVIDLEAFAVPSMFMPTASAPVPGVDAFAPIDAADLAQRVQALQDVLQRPGFHVARMVRQIARLKAATRGATPPNRTGLISPARVPGSNRKRHGLGYHDFYALHGAALGAYRCEFDSS